MFKEFKEFAMKGNVMDMAVGIIIGAAFGKIISSFVSDVLMPPIGLLLGKVDFSNLFLNLSGHGVPLDRRSEGSRRRDAQLRRVPQHGRRLPDRRLRHLHGGQADEPAEAGGSAGARDDKGMPVLHLGHPAQGEAVPALHVGRR